MNILNTLIIGNYDDLRGDSAIYLLERAPSGSTNIYFSGTTGSLTEATILSSAPIITHPDGDFTASINPLNWDDTPANLIYSGSQNGFDLIIYHQQDYGDWQNQDIINATLSASNVGIPVFTQHYNDTNESYSKTASFYGFPPTINVGWGEYQSGSLGSYGNELEIVDTVYDSFIATGATSLASLSWTETNPGAILFTGTGDTVSFDNAWRSNPAYLVATSSSYVATYSNIYSNPVTIKCEFISGPTGGNDFSSPSYGGIAFGSYNPSNFGVMWYSPLNSPTPPTGFSTTVYPVVTQSIVIPAFSNVQIFVQSVHLYDSHWSGTLTLSLV